MLKFDKVRKGAKISNRYNQVTYQAQDTNESQEVSPFPSRWPQGKNNQTRTNA